MSYQQPSDDQVSTLAAPPPGWYLDTGGLRAQRWWDGGQWTQHTQPLPQPQPPDSAAGPGAFGQETARHRQQGAPADGTLYSPDVYPASSPAAEPQQADPYQAPGWPPQQLPSESADGAYPLGPGVPQRGSGSAPGRHRARNTLIASAAGLVLLLVGVSIGAAGKTAKPSPATTVTVTAAAAPAPTVTVTRTVKRAAAASASASAPAQSSGVLFTFSGSGIRNSAPFTVNSSAVTARYSYDCSALGGSGNFIADLVSGSPDSGNYDDQSIANELGSGGGQTTTIYPQDQGATYHLEVNSECSWSIALTSG
jgi:Protein of unknown function (DUF2510)